MTCASTRTDGTRCPVTRCPGGLVPGAANRPRPPMARARRRWRALDARDAQVVVQCTCLGHRSEDEPPLDLSRLHPPLVCAEVIHTPLETAFLAAARRQGCKVHHGEHMLDKQIDAICAFLTGTSCVECMPAVV